MRLEVSHNNMVYLVEITPTGRKHRGKRIRKRAGDISVITATCPTCKYLMVNNVCMKGH